MPCSTSIRRPNSNVFQFVEVFRPAIAADPEVVLKLDPDLLLVSSEARADFTHLLRAAGTPIFRTFTVFSSLDDVRRTILLVGHLSGRDVESQRAAEAFDDAIERARSRRPPAAPAPRVIGYSGGYSYGDATLFDDVITTLGAINLGKENGLHSYESLNSEQILRWNPDWIVSGSARGTTEAALRRLLDDPAISATAAAQKGQIVVLENNVYLPMSPFTSLLLEALGDAFYGSARVVRP